MDAREWRKLRTGRRGKGHHDDSLDKVGKALPFQIAFGVLTAAALMWLGIIPMR